MRSLLWIVILLVTQVFVSTAQTDFPDGDDFNPSSGWIRGLRNIIIVSPGNESEADTFNVELPNIYFEYEGRTITAIRVVRLRPFGTSIADSDYYHANLPGRAGNAIHISTAEFVIRNALMFREGDVVEGIRLAYSERYLRNLDYIGDARIIIVPVSDHEIEIIVVVQDVLPYSADFGTNLETRANFSLTNRNIIGLGVEMQGGVFIDSQKENLMGYMARVRTYNIGRSLVSFQADYLDRYENKFYGFTLRRDFYLPATKYAGQLSYYDARTPVRYLDHSGKYSNITPISIRYNQLDVWAGRAFQIGNNLNKNITLSLGTQSLYFRDRPEKSAEFYYRFQNRTTYLASLTYSYHEFYKASLIYNYGRTEDIPYGYKFSVTGGIENNKDEMYARPYIGANFSSGYFIPLLGYLSGSFSYGTFFNKGIDQGIIDFELKGFSNLYVIENFRHRVFVNLSYTRQLFNRFEDRLIIEGEHGISGFRNDSILGRQRLNLSLEQSFFAPWELYGFRFVFYTFANLSWLGGYDETIIMSNLYSSFGLGIRIRNNRLIFNTLQIQFAYFPNIPKNSNFRYIHFSSEKVMRPLDFMPKAPEVLPMY